MSDQVHERFEIPKEMRSMAEASFVQARKTFERFLESAEATAGSMEERGATVRAGAKDISAKAIVYAEKNVQASLDYAQSLLHAKDLPEVMRLHSEYVTTQMRSLPSRPARWARSWARRRWKLPSPNTSKAKDVVRCSRLTAPSQSLRASPCQAGQHLMVVPAMLHCAQILVAMHKIDIICVHVG